MQLIWGNSNYPLNGFVIKDSPSSIVLVFPQITGQDEHRFRKNSNDYSDLILISTTFRK